MTELRGLAPTPSCFIDQRAQSAGNQVLKNTMATRSPPLPSTSSFYKHAKLWSHYFSVLCVTYVSVMILLLRFIFHSSI